MLMLVPLSIAGGSPASRRRGKDKYPTTLGGKSSQQYREGQSCSGGAKDRHPAVEGATCSSGGGDKHPAIKGGQASISEGMLWHLAMEEGHI
jgi:hypothetical protein